jgi:hypothetical protein
LRPGAGTDLGRTGTSSIFPRREFGVQAWATDLWFSVSENIQRIRYAGIEDGVFDPCGRPVAAVRRSLSMPSYALIPSSTTGLMTCT